MEYMQKLLFFAKLIILCTGWEKIKILGKQIQIKVEKYKEKRKKNSEKGEKTRKKEKKKLRKKRKKLG